VLNVFDKGVHLLPDHAPSGGLGDDTVHAQIERFLHELTSAG
jgi:hypothetical protein